MSAVNTAQGLRCDDVLYVLAFTARISTAYGRAPLVIVSPRVNLAVDVLIPVLSEIASSGGLPTGRQM